MQARVLGSDAAWPFRHGGWWAWCVALIGCTVLVACTSSAAPRSRPSLPAVSGRLFALKDTIPPALTGFRLPQQTVFSVSPDVGTVRSETLASFDAADGLVLTAMGRTARVYQLQTDGTWRSKGRPLPLAPRRSSISLALAGGRALVASCDRVSVLDIDRPGAWHRVGAGCWAALSPDGSAVAFSPDDVHVFTSMTDGSPGGPLFDTGDRADRLKAPVSHAQLIGSPAWGIVGVAFGIRAGDQLAIFVRTDAGVFVRVLEERYVNRSRLPILAWQPGGDLLAIVDDTAGGGILRLFDPATGSLRSVALDALGFDDLSWSPDGRALATLTSQGALLIVATDGTWRLRVQTTWSELLGWAV